MSTDSALLVLRVLVGVLLIGHGSQKLFGWFGGYGLRATSQFFGSIGFRPALLCTPLAGVGEVGGGLLVALGLLNPIGPLGIIACMLIAILKVHWSKGLWAPEGIELALIYLGAAAVFGLVGPGTYSLDSFFGLTLPLAPVFWAGLVAVVVADLILIALAGRPSVPMAQETASQA